MGSKADFIRLIESSQQWLRRFLAGLCCGNMALVDDLAQETYIKAYLSIENCRDDASLKAWILKIAYNSFLNNARLNYKHASIEEVKTIDSGDRSDSKFKYENLYLALEALSPNERAAVVLYYLEGYSSKEISTLLKTKDANVRKALSRGREHLRSLLKQHS